MIVDVPDIKFEKTFAAQLLNVFKLSVLTYHIIEDPNFQKLLLATKNVSSFYKFPSFHHLSMDLLEL